MDIRNLVKKEVRGLKAYHVEDINVRVKMDAMENPYVLPEEIRREIANELAGIELNRYPDPDCRELKDALSEYMGVPAKNLLLGNGSDELIAMVISTFGGTPGAIAHFDPSFAMYGIIARGLGQEVIKLQLDPDFDIDFDGTLKLIMEHKPRVLFVAYPNNPTGNLYDREKLRRLVEGFGGVAVIDEAYQSFSGKSFIDKVGEYDNLIVLRTMSKIGMAGLRLGILAGSEAAVEEINKVRLPYNINSMSQRAALVILRHRVVMDRQISDIISERERLMGALKDIKGVDPFPSDTNFILFKVAGATGVFEALREKGILIKNLDSEGPLMDCLRVTVGRPEENNEFIRELNRIVAG